MAVRTAVPVAPRRALARLDARLADSNRVLWAAAFVPLAALYLATLRVNPANMSPDTVSVTTSAWQLAHHGTPRLPVNTRMFDAWLIPSGPGHVVSNREPGLIGLAAVFYRLLPAASIVDVVPASLAAALVTAAAMGCLAVLARRLVSPRAALAAALIAGTATTTWSVSGTSLWPHGPDQLYLVAAMLAAAAHRPARAGLAFGLAAFTRPPVAIVAAVAGLWQAWTRRSWRPMLLIGAGTAAGLGALLRYAHAYWHGGLVSQYDAVGARFGAALFDVSGHGLGQFAVNIAGTLISPGRGVVIGAPFLLVVAGGLRPAWQVAPPWVRSAAAGGLAYLLVHLKLNEFAGGASFWSYRYPLPTLTLLAPLFVLSWREWVSQTARRRAAFAALVVLAVAMQAVGACTFRRQSTVPWGTTDITAAIHDSHGVAAVILAVGYLAAAVLYRRMSRPAAPAPGAGVDAEPAPPTEPRFRHAAAGGPGTPAPGVTGLHGA